MSKRKIVVTDHVFEDLRAEEEAARAIDAALVSPQCQNVGELLKFAGDADALLNTYLGPIDREVFQAAPKLKVAVRYGIGVDTINVKDATDAGVMVCNVPDYCVNEVADHAVSLFLALARKLPLSDRKIKGGEWSLSYVKPLPALYRSRAGVIGFGRIGRAIAARLQAFGMAVSYFDPGAQGEIDGARPATFPELLETCDVLFVQCPANAQTRHLLNAEAFRLARNKKPFIVNCARGNIVDTDALADALRDGSVSGAGLDVVEDEKGLIETDHPLKHFDNVLLTPHSAWLSTEALQNLRRLAFQEIVRVLNGEKPKSLINPEVLR